MWLGMLFAANDPRLVGSVSGLLLLSISFDPNGFLHVASGSQWLTNSETSPNEVGVVDCCRLSSRSLEISGCDAGPSPHQGSS